MTGIVQGGYQPDIEGSKRAGTMISRELREPGKEIDTNTAGYNRRVSLMTARKYRISFTSAYVGLCLRLTFSNTSARRR